MFFHGNVWKMSGKCIEMSRVSDMVAINLFKTSPLVDWSILKTMVLIQVVIGGIQNDTLINS